MKKNWLFTVLVGLVLTAFFTITPHLAAQNIGHYEMQSLTVGSGDTPISSGIGATLRLTNGPWFVEVVAQSEQTWVIYGPQFRRGGMNGLASISAGVFQGEPWVGPFFKLDQVLGSVAGQSISIGTVQWPILNGWTPRGWEGKPNPEAILFSYFGEAHLNIGSVGLSYAVLKFLHDPWNLLPGASYTQSIGNAFGVTGSATWNSNTKKWLLWMGASWTPPHH